MTPTTSSQIAHAITMHALGVKAEDPAGIFDDFHRIDTERRQIEIGVLRTLMDDYERENRELKTQRQCLILACKVLERAPFAGILLTGWREMPFATRLEVSTPVELEATA